MITDDLFAQMVAEEVKNKLAPAQRKQLMLPENWDRWRRALIALLKNLEEQIEILEADKDADAARYAAMGRDGKRLAEASAAAYAQRLNKVNRFKFHVQNRIHAVESMIESGESVDSTSAVDVEFYRKAIRTHRKLLEEHDMEATPIDQALWAALENRWEFDSIEALVL